MKSFLILLFSLSISMPSLAATDSCASLKQELKAMQKTQQQVVASLVNNHESFASSLEEYSLVVKTAKGASSTSTVSTKMNESAQAFRSRGIQGKKIATKLNVATADLLARVASCLE